MATHTGIYYIIAPTYVDDSRRKKRKGCGATVSCLSERFFLATEEGMIFKATFSGACDRILGLVREQKADVRDGAADLSLRLGVAHSFADMQDVATKLAFADWLRVVENCQSKNYDRDRRAMLLWRRLGLSGKLVPSQRPHFLEELSAAHLPSADDPRARLAPLPSDGYLTEQWLIRQRLSEAARNQSFSMVPASNCGFDGGYKVRLASCSPSDLLMRPPQFLTRCYGVTNGLMHMYLLVQQDNNIRYTMLSDTKAQEQFRDELKKLSATQERLGYPPISMIWVDDIHHMAAHFADHGPISLRGRDLAPVPEHIQERLVVLEDRMRAAPRTYIRISADDPQTEAVEAAIAAVRAAPIARQALDLEWRTEPPEPGLDVMQIGSPEGLFVLQVRRQSVSIAGAR